MKHFFNEISFFLQCHIHFSYNKCRSDSLTAVLNYWDDVFSSHSFTNVPSCRLYFLGKYVSTICIYSHNVVKMTSFLFMTFWSTVGCRPMLSIWKIQCSLINIWKSSSITVSRNNNYSILKSEFLYEIPFLNRFIEHLICFIALTRDLFKNIFAPSLPFSKFRTRFFIVKK